MLFIFLMAVPALSSFDSTLSQNYYQNSPENNMVRGYTLHLTEENTTEHALSTNADAHSLGLGSAVTNPVFLWLRG